MADSITWLLNADASAVRAEMNAAVTAVNSGTNQMAGGFTKAELAHGTFLKSNARVSNQIGHFAQTAISGADSLTLMSTAMEGLAHATKLPLGPLAALLVAGVVGFKVHEAGKEFAALNKEADELIKKDLTKEKTEQLEKTKTAAEELSKKMAELHSSWLKGAVNAVIENRHGGDPDPIARRGDAMARALGPDPLWAAARLQIIEGGKNAAEAYYKQRLADIPKEVEAEIAKRKHEEEVGKEAASFKDKLQLSLADIAKEGLHKRTSASFDNTKQYAGDVAERAISEEKAARTAVLKGNFGEAIQHQSIAEQLKATIPGLKDSEKIATFKSALDTSERLKEIAQKVSFAGK